MFILICVFYASSANFKIKCHRSIVANVFYSSKLMNTLTIKSLVCPPLIVGCCSTREALAVAVVVLCKAAQIQAARWTVTWVSSEMKVVSTSVVVVDILDCWNLSSLKAWTWAGQLHPQHGLNESQSNYHHSAIMFSQTQNILTTSEFECWHQFRGDRSAQKVGACLPVAAPGMG